MPVLWRRLASFSAWQYILVVFLFSIHRAHRRATFDKGRGLSDDSTIKRAGLFISVLLVYSGDSMMGGEMDPVDTR